MQDMKIKRILFPMELAPISDRIAPYVRYYADSFGAKIHVVHVLAEPTQVVAAYFAEPQLIKTRDVLAKEAEAVVKKFCQNNQLEGQRAILIGDTVDALIEYIEKHDIDQVIMGTHGRRGLENILLGSVARRLVRFAPVPVLTINPFLMEELAKKKSA